jgi:hypothetical protein
MTSERLFPTVCFVLSIILHICGTQMHEKFAFMFALFMLSIIVVDIMQKRVVPVGFSSVNLCLTVVNSQVLSTNFTQVSKLPFVLPRFLVTSCGAIE